MFNDSTGNVTTTTTPSPTSFDERNTTIHNTTTASPTSVIVKDAAGWLGTFINEPFLNEYQNVPYSVNLIFPILGVLTVIYTLHTLHNQPATTSALMAHMNTVAFCIAFLPESLVVAACYYVVSCALSKYAYRGGRRTHLLFSLTLVGLAIATAMEATFHEIRALVWTYITIVVIHAGFVQPEIYSTDNSHPRYFLFRMFFLDACVAILFGIFYEQRLPNATWILMGFMSLLKGYKLFEYYTPIPVVNVIPHGLETHAVASAPAPPPPTQPPPPTITNATVAPSEFHTFRESKKLNPLRHFRATATTTTTTATPTEAPIDLRRIHLFRDDDDDIENEDVSARL